jgi:small multidrug resistance pump
MAFPFCRFRLCRKIAIKGHLNPSPAERAKGRAESFVIAPTLASPRDPVESGSGRSGESGAMNFSYLFLALAIVSEVVATTSLSAWNGLTRLWPSVTMAAGYGIAFVCLAFSLKTIPIGIAYAIWSGAGIVLIAGLGWYLYRQSLDWPAIIGLSLIVAGISIMQMFSANARL